MSQRLDYLLGATAGSGRKDAWRLPLYDLELRDSPPEDLRVAAKRDGTPTWPKLQLRGGCLLARDFPMPKPVGDYSPLDCADEILARATAIDSRSDRAILDFCRRFGVLGLALPDTPWIDMLLLTKKRLSDIQRVAKWLVALEANDWTSNAIPPIETLRQAVIGAPADLSSRDRKRLAWYGLGATLNKHLSHAPLLLLAAFGADRLEAVIRPGRLGDLLWFQLAKAAMPETERARTCLNCGGLFVASASNSRRAYCTPACRNRHNVQKAYRKKKMREAASPKRRKGRSSWQNVERVAKAKARSSSGKTDAGRRRSI